MQDFRGALRRVAVLGVQMTGAKAGATFLQRSLRGGIVQQRCHCRLDFSSGAHRLNRSCGSVIKNIDFGIGDVDDRFIEKKSLHRGG